MSLLTRCDAPLDRTLFEAGEKLAADAQVSYDLVGLLQLSQGRIILSAPNLLVRGLHSALGEHGLELPTIDGTFNAGIEVISPDEVKMLGGPDKITESSTLIRPAD